MQRVCSGYLCVCVWLVYFVKLLELCGWNVLRGRSECLRSVHCWFLSRKCGRIELQHLRSGYKLDCRRELVFELHRWDL